MKMMVNYFYQEARNVSDQEKKKKNILVLFL